MQRTKPRSPTLCSLLAGLCLVAGGARGGEPASWPGQVTPDDPHYDLELLYHQGRYEEGRQAALAKAQLAPDDVDLLILLLRFNYQIAEAEPKGSKRIDKERWYEDMVEMADHALQLRPDDARGHLARGAARARLGTTRGLVASAMTLPSVEADVRFAADARQPYASIGGEEIQPCDAYLVLGIIYRLVPEWWIVEAMTGTRGDLDESLRWLERANACAPGRIEPMKELGVARLCYGQRRAAPEVAAAGAALLREVTHLSPSRPTEVADVAHARMILDDPQLACAYSRDGQAEVDRRALPEPALMAQP